jgi:hypothetical protein
MNKLESWKGSDNPPDNSSLGRLLHSFGKTLFVCKHSKLKSEENSKARKTRKLPTKMTHITPSASQPLPSAPTGGMAQELMTMKQWHNLVMQLMGDPEFKAILQQQQQQQLHSSPGSSASSTSSRTDTSDGSSTSTGTTTPPRKTGQTNATERPPLRLIGVGDSS